MAANLFRDARACFTTGDHERCVMLCEDLLERDESNPNYNVLLLAGKASFLLQNIAKAELFYRRAVEISPDQIPGWQGLSELFGDGGGPDRMDEKMAEKMVQVHEKLSQMFLKDANMKWRESREKQAIALDVLRRYRLAGSAWLSLCNDCEDRQQLIRFSTCAVIALENALTVKSDLNGDIEFKTEMMRAMAVAAPRGGHPEMCRKYVELLKSMLSMGELIEECKRLCSEFPNTMEAAFVTLILSSPFKECQLSEKQVLNFSVRAVHMFPASCSAGWLGICATRRPNADFLKTVPIRDKTTTHFGCLAMAACQLSQNANEAVLQSVRQGLSLAVPVSCSLSSNYAARMRLIESKAQMSVGSYSGATAAAKAVIGLLNDGNNNSSSDNNEMVVEAMKVLGSAAKELGKDDDAYHWYEELLRISLGEDHDALNELGLLHLRSAMKKNKEEEEATSATNNKKEEELKLALGFAERAVSLCASVGNYHLSIAKIKWEMGDGSYRRDKSQCLRHLLDAGKLSPQCGEVFSMLGRYYLEVAENETNARKCFVKAVQLNPMDEYSGIALTQSYEKAGQHSLAAAVYRECSSADARATWAWMGLGKSLLKQQNGQEISSAVALEAEYALQKATRLKSFDDECWELLAFAYEKNGKFTAALRCYERSLELNPQTQVFSAYRAVALRISMGLFHSAYHSMTKEYSEMFPASAYEAMMGDLCVAWGWDMWAHGFIGSSLSLLDEAEGHLNAALKFEPSISHVQKRLGDCMALRGLVKRQHVVNNSPSLERKTQDLRGVRAYSRVVMMHPWVSSSWADLGLSLYLSGQDKQKTVDCMKNYVALSFKSPGSWVSLGICEAMKDGSEDTLESQHALIQSLLISPRCTDAWDGLGYLYLSRGQKQLAERAFMNSRSCYPDSPSPWVGHTLAVTSVLMQQSAKKTQQQQQDDEEEDWVKCAKWLSHATKISLSQTVELCAASANALVMAGLVTSQEEADLCSRRLQKYLEIYPSDVWALNLQGCLLERAGQLAKAKELFELALHHQQLQKKDVRGIQINLSRVSQGVSTIEAGSVVAEACKACSDVGNSLLSSGDITKKKNAVTTAVKKATSLLQQCPTASFQEHYKYPLQDAESIVNTPNGSSHCPKNLLCSQRTRDSVLESRRAVHLQPWESYNWNLLVSASLRSESAKYSVAPLLRRSTTTTLGRYQSECIADRLESVAAGSVLLKEVCYDGNEGKRAAKSWVHLHPYSQRAWNCLQTVMDNGKLRVVVAGGALGTENALASIRLFKEEVSSKEKEDDSIEGIKQALKKEKSRMLLVKLGRKYLVERQNAAAALWCWENAAKLMREQGDVDSASNVEMMMAEVRMRTGDVKEAHTILSQVSKQTESAQLHLMTATVQHMQFKNHDSSLKKAKKLDPTNTLLPKLK